jgi:alpha,alpha-trehalase
VATTPIGDYALLSDRHSAALVSRGGSIDWLCFPRFDSPSIFGRLLDEKAGHWFLGATNATEVSRRYLNRTMVLETTLRTPTGSVTITDALALGSGNRRHDSAKERLTFSCGTPRVRRDGSTCPWSTSRAPITG